MGKYVGSQKSAKAGVGPASVEPDDLVEGRFPAIWEYLTAQAWDDGSPRQTATLLLFVEDGVWKACLNDRANGRTAWASASSVFGLLDALDGQLAGDAVAWRRKPSEGKGRGR